MLEQLQITDPLDDIIGLQSHFLSSKSMEDRKTLGQFFTGSIVSEYMASLINKPSSKSVRLLDAGAAFPDRAEFRKNAADIAWETEVWIADNPDHMIHFNGDRFLGPHES